MVSDLTFNTGRKRYLEIDALRGFAIVAIFLYHSSIYFNYPSGYIEHNSFFQISDDFIKWFSYHFLFGKLFTIFAFLFGFTFYLQIETSNKKSVLTNKRYAWRMFLLFCLGVINSVFFPEGDILILYSLIGLVMIPLKNAPTVLLSILAIVLILFPIQLYQITRLLSSESYVLPPRNSELFKSEVSEALRSGNLWQMIKVNIRSGIPASLLWQYENGRMGQALGVFILGIVAGRARIFNASLYNWRFWIKTCVSLVCITGLIFFLKKMAVTKIPNQSIRLLTDELLMLWLSLVTTGVIVAGFILLYHLARGKFLHPLTYLGKTALTNYVLQSMMGAFIFSPLGLNLANRAGITFCFSLTGLLLIMQTLISRLWLKTHRRGPFEGIWHKLTWLQSRQ